MFYHSPFRQNIIIIFLSPIRKHFDHNEFDWYTGYNLIVFIFVYSAVDDPCVGHRILCCRIYAQSVYWNLAPMRSRDSLTKTTKLGVHRSCSKPRFCVTYTTNRQTVSLHVGNKYYRYLQNNIIISIPVLKYTIYFMYL